MARITEFRRRGDRVWRPATANSGSVAELLRYLEGHGFEGAPQLQPLDSDGAMWVSWVGGWVQEEDQVWMLGTAALFSVGRLLRSYHDAAAGFAPTGEFEEGPTELSPGTIVCHGDIAPRNTVFRDGRAAAFIDWDGIWISNPLWDLGHAIWQFGPVCPDGDPRLSSSPQLLYRRERIGALARGYGDEAAADRIAPIVEDVIAGCRRSLVRKAAAGSKPFMRMITEGMLGRLDSQLGAARSLQSEIASAIRSAV